MYVDRLFFGDPAGWMIEAPPHTRNSKNAVFVSMARPTQFVQFGFLAITFERKRIRRNFSHASDPRIKGNKKYFENILDTPTLISSNYGATPRNFFVEDWEKIWVLDKMLNISTTNVFLKNRKKNPPGEFQQESIAVVYFKIVRLEIARELNQMASEIQFIVYNFFDFYSIQNRKENPPREF